MNWKETVKTNEKLIGICGKLGRQFPPLTSPMSAAAPTRARGVPLGEPLCGYHTPSSGCTGLKERGGERRTVLKATDKSTREQSIYMCINGHVNR